MGRTKMTALKSDPVGAARLNALYVIRQLREIGVRTGIRELNEQEDISYELLERGALTPTALLWLRDEARGRSVYIYPVAFPYAGRASVGYRIE
jgi:hypothetical protein